MIQIHLAVKVQILKSIISKSNLKSQITKLFFSWEDGSHCEEEE